jgi:hypothetical protein
MVAGRAHLGDVDPWQLLDCRPRKAGYVQPHGRGEKRMLFFLVSAPMAYVSYHGTNVSAPLVSMLSIDLVELVVD